MSQPVNDQATSTDNCAVSVPRTRPVRRSGMFIDDAEISERFGDKAQQIIAALDELGTTQKNKASRPKEARLRPAVDVWLEANGYGAVTANMGEF